MCGPLLSWIEWSSGENSKNSKGASGSTLPATRAGRRVGAVRGKAEGIRRRVRSGSSAAPRAPGRSAVGVAGGPQVHSLSAMQMTCKSARASGRPRCESGRGASRSGSPAFTRVRSGLSRLLALRPGRSPPARSVPPGRASPAAGTAESAAAAERALASAPDAFAARVSEPVPRFCPGAALGAALRGRGSGVGGRRGHAPSGASPDSWLETGS